MIIKIVEKINVYVPKFQTEFWEMIMHGSFFCNFHRRVKTFSSGCTFLWISLRYKTYKQKFPRTSFFSFTSSLVSMTSRKRFIATFMQCNISFKNSSLPLTVTVWYSSITSKSCSMQYLNAVPKNRFQKYFESKIRNNVYIGIVIIYCKNEHEDEHFYCTGSIINS